MPDVAALKSKALAQMVSAGMIHPHTGADVEAERILDEFAKGFVVPEVKEKRKSDAS